jgi:hypothetical protein
MVSAQSADYDVVPPTLRPILERVAHLEAFEAPYLLDKLLSEKMVRSRDEGALLFREAKRFLALRDALGDAVVIPVFSRRVDEAWHQLVLYTVEYAAFSRRFFGKYLHHTPNQARSSLQRELSFDEFRAAYETMFGTLPVELWRDELSIDADTRVIRADFGAPVTIERDGEHVSLVFHVADPPRVLLRTHARAEDALRFLLDTDVFYIRELPGRLSNEDRFALCRPLITTHVLRVAP